MRLDRRLLGWGLFFIVLGLVPLAVQAGVIDRDVVGRWPLLWPLLLIGLGLGLVLRGTRVAWVGGTVAAVTLGLIGGGAIATGFDGLSTISGCGGARVATAFPTKQGSFARQTDAGINIEFSCGTLAVGTVDGSDWSVSGSDATGQGPEIEAPPVPSGDTYYDNHVTLRTGTGGGGVFDLGHGRVTWNVTIPRSRVMDLGLTLNAGTGMVSLAGASLSALDMTINAGSIRLDASEAARLPDQAFNVTVNAGSATILTPAFNGTMDLSLNAGSLDVCVPTGTALRVDWGGTLSSNDLDSLGLVKVDQKTWTTPQFDPTKDHIELRMSANAGRFGLHIGGSCGA